MTDRIRIGDATTGLAAAKMFVTRYTTTPSEHWAYPAYDAYPGGPSVEVTEQDLLAPLLLNVPRISVRTYDGLRDALPDINKRLCVPELDMDLTDAGPETINALAELFALLDTPDLPGVKLTVFAKILHRKRPATIPLYDSHIWRCYAGLGTPSKPARIETVKGRSWEDFARAWLPEVQADLANQRAVWQELASLTSSPTITPLRALDMIGWALGDPKRRFLND